MDDIYDSFLFSEERLLQTEEDMQYCLPDTDRTNSETHSLQERSALDELVKVLSKEAREYMIFRLQTTPQTPIRRTAYSAVKNSNVKKHLRHVMLLTATLVSKGDPHALIVDTAEDLQVAQMMSIDDPYDSVRLHKRRRQAHCKAGKEDLASKLLSNLAAAYRQNCKKRAEKKRVLSIAAAEITYAEGKRLFGCGPVQFSEAKKHYTQFGPFADPKPNLCPDQTILKSFAKRFFGCEPTLAWKEFCICHSEVAERIGQRKFLDTLRSLGSESSIDTDEMMNLTPEEYKFMADYEENT